MNEIDNPGSGRAVREGCLCSPATNRNGEGAGTNGRGERLFVPAKNCPLHGDEKARERHRRRQEKEGRT